jgi:hypothetical protein
MVVLYLAAGNIRQKDAKNPSSPSLTQPLRYIGREKKKHTEKVTEKVIKSLFFS